MKLFSLPAFSLEAGVQTHKEGVGGCLLKHMLLCLHPVYILHHRGQTFDTLAHYLKII